MTDPIYTLCHGFFCKTVFTRSVASAFVFLLRTVLPFAPSVAMVYARADEAIDFSRDIRPILASHCFHCHGPDEATREADLRLDTEDGARAALEVDGGMAKLIDRVTSEDPDRVMPPPDVKKPLAEHQITLLRRWVDADAPWGAHWAFQPLVAPAIPAVVPAPAAALHNPIDHFVQARLAAKGVSPSPAASRQTWLRRVTLDLTGLPPTPADVEAFVNDTSDDAWDKVVDRLLDSPAYGQRMAWPWLDAARYADSNGYQGDNERTMWPWRDWVVDALNRNLPYDDFTVWQLAGDLLPDATFEQKLATGFCRNHMINGEGGRIAEENRVEYVMDMTETAGTVWLGLTLNCCRCHDHKFDPLTQHDYYRLSAFFNQTPVNGGGGNPQTPPVLDAPSDDQRQRLAELDSRVDQLQPALRQREEELAKSQQQWETEMLAKAGQRAWNTLMPTTAKAIHQTLEIQADGTILASGENPPNDTYTIELSSDLRRITAIRLEALNHDSHTQGGLARSDSGNFVLTGFEVAYGRSAPTRIEPDDWTAVKIASAQATFEQGGFSIDRAFDGKPNTGWAVYSGKPIDRSHWAIFTLAEPLEFEPDGRLVITLRHDSPHRSHNIGRFRLSVSGLPGVKLENENDSLLEVLRIQAEQRTQEQAQQVMLAHRADDAAHAALKKQLDEQNKSLADLRAGVAKVMIMQDMPSPRKTFVLNRGVYSKQEDEVSADVPGALPALSTDQTANRLALARWIVSDENPLAARVAVNRFWQQFFGIGLVKTTEDFGVQGEIPIHQDLLDWLAADFRQHGWDVKRLVKQIVTSHTYRQSSRISNRSTEGVANAYGLSHEDDPENRYLSRGPRFRMPAWMIRDQALAASGLLVADVGGPPVNGYQPPGVWEEATFGRKNYKQDQGDALYRRSLYTFWRRIIAPTMFFDNASRQTCTVNPLRTNTPLHSLLTFNDITYVEAAGALADRILSGPSQTDQDRIDELFIRLLARRANVDESEILIKAINRSRNEYRNDPEAANKLISIGESKRNDQLDRIELAAWTSLTLTVMNLDETLTKE